MSVYPSNILQAVQTYQRSYLGLLQNMAVHVAIANTQFKDFNKQVPANLGSTITFDLPPRFTTTAGLVAAWQAAAQRVSQITVDQANNTSYAVTAQELIFNLDKGGEIGNYLPVFGRSGVAELGSKVDINIALNWISGVVSQLDGTTNTFSGPFRFYGDGSTPINSYQQLQQQITYFKNFGSVQEGIKVVLPDTVPPYVVGSGLNQFAPRRNDEIANSWEIGEFGTPPVMYYASNLMPIHTSGNSGVNGDTFTVVSTNDSSGQNVTQITVTTDGTATDANAVYAGDLFQFQDIANYTNLRYLTFIGHAVSANPVQIRATADAASSGSSITLSFTPALNWAGGANQNLNTPIVAGMQLTGLPSHRAGGVLGGDALFVAMPTLPDQSPFATASEHDEETGVSLRLTHGSLLGQNQTGMILDEAHGSNIVSEYSMRTIVPLSQG